MASGFAKLPSHTLTRIFEYLFWQGVRDEGIHLYASLPIGQLQLLPCLHVCRSWRKRARHLFYKVAVVVAGDGSKSLAESSIVLSRRSGRSSYLRTNIELLLESGLASKVKYLVVFADRKVLPEDIAIELEISQFAAYEWPSITKLFFHLSHGLSEIDEEYEQDDAIATINQYLLNSLPSLSSICSLSNICDSFGLYSLDDLITNKANDLKELITFSKTLSLKLGVQTIPHYLTRLTICGSKGTDAIHIPHILADSLVCLDIGPIMPDNIWGTFTGRNKNQMDFPNLKYLGLTFTEARLAEASTGGKGAKRATKHYASPGPSNAVIQGSYPLFPKLQSMKIEAYPYNIVQFLENFPRSQISHLELKRCPHKFHHFSLDPFTNLSSAKIHVPDIRHSNNHDNIKEWTNEKLFRTKLDHLKVLLLVAGPSIHVSLPHHYHEHCHMGNLQELTLGIGIKFSAVTSILRALHHLRFLELTITEAKGKTRDRIEKGKEMFDFSKHQLLSKSLERFTIYLYGLTEGRQKRALARVAWLLSKVPSILQLRIQRDCVETMQACIQKVIESKGAPDNVDHLRALQLRVVH